MIAAEAREHILGVITTLQLTRKEIRSLEDEAAKWKSRVDLARSRGILDLLAEAEKEAEKIHAKLSGLREEEQTLKDSVDSTLRQLPGLAARQRSVDPDILEQELLIALGHVGEEAETEKAFGKLEKESAADAALEALKARM